MELVYLWVEDYKNIKSQGFNFSPRFECEFYPDYDGNGNLTENSKLEIIEKEYVNIFPENINITAIVGKNGSGKSSLSEIILSKVPHKKYNKYIVVGYDRIKDKYYSWGSIEKFELEGIERIDTISLDLSAGGVEICGRSNRDYNHNLIYINGVNLDFRTMDKFEYSDEDDNIFIPKYITQYKKNKDILKSKTFFYEFDKVRFILRDIDYYELINDIKYHSNNLDYLFEKDLEESLQFDFSNDPFCNIFKKVLVRFYIISNKTYNREIIDKIFLAENCFEFAKEDFPSIPNIDNIIDALKYLKSNSLQTKNSITNKPIYYYDFSIEDENLDKLWIFENFFNISYFIGTKKENLPIFDLELYDSKKDLSYNLLSNGEKQYLRLLVEIISNRSSGDLSSSIEPTIYIFDEIETSLHPEWQKKVFNDIYNIFRLWGKNVHLIFLTHSPFLLSDIPKQNIIFLDTYKEEDEEVKKGLQKVGNCKVLSKDEVLEKKQTFGANIHTLLSDSFFMKDGLMGEFAKSKIEEVIKFLNNEKSEIKDHKEVESIINIIGEPILQKKLQVMLERYKEENNLINPQDIEKQIQELQEKLNRIKKNG